MQKEFKSDESTFEANELSEIYSLYSQCKLRRTTPALKNVQCTCLQ